MFALIACLGDRARGQDRHFLDRDPPAGPGARSGRVWRDDGLSLVHRLSPLTAEDRLDHQPISGGGGRFVLAGDFQLFDRPELVEALGLAVAEARDLPDSALVLAAWERWRDAAVERLKGNFSFLVVDREARAVFVVCDRTGHRAAYYCIEKDVVSIASSLPALLACPDVPRVTDPVFLGRFMIDDPFIDDQTPFQHIKRVPWGTVLRIDWSGNARRHRYWRLNPENRVRLRRDEDYVEAGLALTDKAIGQSSRITGPLVSSLSAGFDSAAVVAGLVRNNPGKPVRALTCAPAKDRGSVDGIATDESDQAALHAAHWDSVEHTTLRFGDRQDRLWRSPEAWFATSGFPLRNVDTFEWWEGLFAEARRLGARAVYTGEGGNLGFSWDGEPAITAWTSKGRLLAALEEVSQLSRTGQSGWSRTSRRIWRLMVAPFLPTRMRRLIDDLRFDRAWPPMLRDSLLNPAFYDQHGFSENFATRGMSPYRDFPSDSRALREVWFGMIHYSFSDRREAVRQRDGIEIQAPLFDPELLEFCHAIPEEQFLNAGRTRWLARRMLADRVPASVLGPLPGFVQGGDRVARLNSNRDRYGDALDEVSESALARELIDLPRLRKLLDDWPSGDNPDGFNRDTAYGRAIPRALHIGQFIRWAEGGNR